MKAVAAVANLAGAQQEPPQTGEHRLARFSNVLKIEIENYGGECGDRLLIASGCALSQKPNAVENAAAGSFLTFYELGNSLIVGSKNPPRVSIALTIG